MRCFAVAPVDSQGLACARHHSFNRNAANASCPSPPRMYHYAVRSTGVQSTVGSRGVVADGAGADPLTGYILLTADSLDSAADLAEGCPILQAGGKVEVGGTFD